MAQETEFRRDGKATPAARNRALIALLMGAWSGRDLVLLERKGEEAAKEGGWKATYHNPARGKDE